MAKWPYNTRRWQRLRSLKLSMNPLCEYCPAERITEATHVDHKKAIAAGGEPFELENLASSCHSCHSRKTMIMDGGGGNAKRTRVPLKGCSLDGTPADPGHWWNQEEGETPAEKSLKADKPRTVPPSPKKVSQVLEKNDG